MKALRGHLALAALALVAGCDRVLYEWQRPSSNFVGLDANADGDVDRLERELAHGALFSERSDSLRPIATRTAA